MITRPQGKLVVFYDGLCPLCNGFVRRLIRRDKEEKLLFSPLQGQTAKAAFADGNADRPATSSSVVVWDEKGFRYRSSAVLRISRALPGLNKLWAILYVVPSPLRDLVYDWIARNRRRWFGQFQSCPAPSDHLRHRFLP